MSITTAISINRETFKPYAKLGKSNSKIQDRICDLLSQLVQTDDPTKVKQLCLEEVEWLESEHSNPNTQTSYITAMRKAIAAYFEEHKPPNSLLNEYKGASQHLALCHLFAADEAYAQKSAINKEKTANQRDNLTGFDAEAAIKKTKELLNSNDWKELAVGLIMASQSRPSDMLKTGDFKAISKYLLEFTSRAKKRGKVVKGKIFCLVDSITFIDAFSRLRRMPEVMKINDWALKDIDSAKNKSLNRAVREVYENIIPIPYGEKELSCKNLRASGVNAAYWLHGREDQSLGRFAELQLLHDNPGTAANYEDYYAADSKGKRLLQVGILKDEPLVNKPQSKQRSSISVDTQLREMIGNAELWGEGTHTDRLERIIARALQANKLEAQLARTCEKLQKVELKLKRLQSANKSKPVVESEPVQVEETTIAEPSGFNWRDVPNDELNGNRNHTAYVEKLRRSVEAIQEYNAGLDLSEQFSITGSILRQLTKVKPGKVKEWMAENKTVLDSYNSGFAPRQNTGKPDPRDVIKWNEDVYGTYEW